MRPGVVLYEEGLDDRVIDGAVTDIRRAASLKAGGVGIRYTVRIGRSTTWLFLEDNRWFVERRSAGSGTRLPRLVNPGNMA